MFFEYYVVPVKAKKYALNIFGAGSGEPVGKDADGMSRTRGAGTRAGGVGLGHGWLGSSENQSAWI
jgi:hypothetical protein